MYERKNNWVESISKYQNVQPTGFMICANHFNQNDFTPKRQKPGGEQILRNGAVPNIFPPQSNKPVQQTNAQIQTIPKKVPIIKPAACKDCVALNIELIKAKNRIASLLLVQAKRQEMLKQQKVTIADLRKENTKLKEEKSNYLSIEVR